jgi:hypothetical protein
LLNTLGTQCASDHQTNLCDRKCCGIWMCTISRPDSYLIHKTWASIGVAGKDVEWFNMSIPSVRVTLLEMLFSQQSWGPLQEDHRLTSQASLPSFFRKILSPSRQQGPQGVLLRAEGRSFSNLEDRCRHLSSPRPTRVGRAIYK